jgi:hypothetical protein
VSTKISFRRGDTFATTVTVVDENDIPQSLSGATATWTIARCEGGEALIVKTTDDDVIVTDAAAGELYLSLTGDEDGDGGGETASLPTGVLWHSLRVWFANGDIQTVIADTCTVRDTP